MKKLFSTLCIAGAALGITACGTDGDGFRDTAPYSAERTAGSEPGWHHKEKMKSDETSDKKESKVESAEPVFEKKMRK